MKMTIFTIEQLIPMLAMLSVFATIFLSGSFTNDLSFKKVAVWLSPAPFIAFFLLFESMYRSGSIGLGMWYVALIAASFWAMLRLAKGAFGSSGEDTIAKPKANLEGEKLFENNKQQGNLGDTRRDTIASDEDKEYAKHLKRNPKVPQRTGVEV